MDRPMGVTALSILNALGGTFFIFAGISLLLHGDVYAKMMMGRFQLSVHEMSLMMKYIATAFIIGGVISIVVAFGLWIGATWAWWLYLIIQILNLISAILTIPSGIFAIMIVLLIIYYMTRPHVRKFFNV